jgi:hypothetical protein
MAILHVLLTADISVFSSPVIKPFQKVLGSSGAGNRGTGTDSQDWWKPGLVRNGGRSRALNSQGFTMIKISTRGGQAVA